MDREIIMAQKWADSLWKRSSKKWLDRKQDLNYRRLVSRPCMEDVLRTPPVIKKGLFLDLGCGSGSETIHLKKVLEKKGCTGELIGFDRNGAFVNFAEKRRYEIGHHIKLTFERKDIEEIENKYIGQVDLVASVFLLQDLPDAGTFFEVTSKLLKKGGYGVFLLLHPNFADKKRKEGVIKIQKYLRAKQWKWVAKYPIVEEREETFFVPYFHRTICDYTALARKYFKAVSFIDVLPSDKVIAESADKKESPLYAHSGNVYYPEIVKIPSSLIIKIQK